MIFSQDMHSDLHETVSLSSSALVYHTSWEIFRESFGIIHSLLSGCVGVQMSAHVLDLQLQIQLGTLPGALSHTCTQTHTQVTEPGNISFALLKTREKSYCFF